MTIRLFCLFFFLSTFVVAQGSDCIERVSELERAFKEEEALKQMLACLNLNPASYQGICKASMLYSKCGNRLKTNEEKKKYFNLAKRYAAVAVKHKPNDAEGHYVMAVAMGRIALLSGPSDKVGAARDIKQHVDAALKADANHAGAWFLLGKWYYEVANLNFAELAAAKYLFGGIPEGATVEKAIEAYKKSVALNPNQILFRSDLAIAYKDIGKTREAIYELETLVQMKPLEQDDPKIIANAKSLLKELKTD